MHPTTASQSSIRIHEQYTRNNRSHIGIWIRTSFIGSGTHCLPEEFPCQQHTHTGQIPNKACARGRLPFRESLFIIRWGEKKFKDRVCRGANRWQPRRIAGRHGRTGDMKNKSPLCQRTQGAFLKSGMPIRHLAKNPALCIGLAAVALPRVAVTKGLVHVMMDFARNDCCRAFQTLHHK